MTEVMRKRVLVTGSRPDIQVPFQEIGLHDSPDGKANPPLRRYDTAGPGAERESGLPELRQAWIEERSDTERYPGRTGSVRDDGRAVAREGRRYPPHPREGRPPRRARTGRAVTQLHYARQGMITPEMEFVAIREGLDPEFVRDEIASGRAILPANINHPESEPMAIGTRLPGQGQRQHRQLGGGVLDQRGGREARRGPPAGAPTRSWTFPPAATSTPPESGSSATRRCRSAPCPSTRPSRRSTAVAEDLTWEVYRDTVIEQAEQGVDYFTVHAGVLLRYVPLTAKRVTGIVEPGRLDPGGLVPGPPQGELPLHPLRGAVRDHGRLRRGLLPGRRPAARVDRRRQRRGPVRASCAPSGS